MLKPKNTILNVWLAWLPYMANRAESTQGFFYDYTRLLIDLGKYKEAKPYVDALLFYYKTLDGENNLRYIGLLNCNAIIYQKTGNYKEAIDIYSRIIIENKLLILGDTLGHVIQMSNLGDVYREIGEFDLGTNNLKNAKKLYYKYGGLSFSDKNSAGKKLMISRFKNWLI